MQNVLNLKKNIFCHTSKKSQLFREKLLVFITCPIKFKLKKKLELLFLKCDKLAHNFIGRNLSLNSITALK